VILRHALRNALITPSRSSSCSSIFCSRACRGRGLLPIRWLRQAAPRRALFGDIYVIQAATLVAVFIAVLSQIISDIAIRS